MIKLTGKNSNFLSSEFIRLIRLSNNVRHKIIIVHYRTMLRTSSSKLYSTAYRGLIQTQTVRAAGAHAHNLSAFSTKSSSPSSESKKGNTSKCPFSQGTTSRDLSSNAAATLGMNVDSVDSTTAPALQVVPAWPIIGSFFGIIPGIGKHVREYYDLPEMGSDNIFDFYLEMHEKFGDFYVIDIPGLGKTHFLTEPKEMIKVLRQEGAYPRGGISSLTPFIKWCKENGLSLAQGEDNGFFGQGDTWRTARTFLQSDMLSPHAARGYVPGMVEAAEIASKGADHYADDMNTYLHYCAFDMFQTIMFGELTKVSDPSTPTDPVNEEFVENSVTSLALMVRQIFDKNEAIKGQMGITTPMYKEFDTAMQTVNKIANDKISAFKAKWERGELSDAEKSSYIALAFERQKADKTVSSQQMAEIVMFSLNAGVDTTSTFIAWAMVHLGLNSDVQEKLYEELKSNLNENGGTLTSDMLSKAKSPYLHTVLRESHRISPVHPTVMMKSNSTDEIEIHGAKFPKGTLFSFDSFSLGMDPDFVENPDEFNPDRWTPEATKARKGTPSEIFDHQFYKDPFSQGARRCPGSRIAVNETLVLLSQLVLDWKFEPAEDLKSYKDVKYEQKTLVVPVLPKMKFVARA